jgi:hypothetical protein
MALDPSLAAAELAERRPSQELQGQTLVVAVAALARKLPILAARALQGLSCLSGCSNWRKKASSRIAS